MVNPQPGQPSYRGGQCRDVGYTVTLSATNFNTRFGPCGVQHQIQVGVTGPVYGLINSQGFITISAWNGVGIFFRPEIRDDTSLGCADYFDTFIHASDTKIVNIVRADGQPDNCGNAPQPPQQNPCNPLPGQPACPVTTPANSDFDTHSGSITETVDLVTYQSLGETRGVNLRYSSLAADPRPILHFRYSQVYNPNQTIIAKFSIQRGSFTYQVPGYLNAQFGLTGGENFWSVPVANNPGFVNGIIEAALQADLRTQPSGQYQYTVQRGIQYIDSSAPAFSPLGAAETATFVHVNRVNSPFGAGWSLAGWQEIIENPDGSVLLLDGDGTQLLFGAPPAVGSPFISPPGDFSRLERLANGTYQRTLTDQTIYSFNAQRRLASVRDRNGNLAQYTYNAAGQLTQITDPVSLRTTFTYTSGRVTQITHPGNLITRLEYNAAGDLIRLTHPDNTVWQWEYQDHRMTASSDPRNNRGTFQYDFAGRATSATRRDGQRYKSSLWR
jgi:YD repeat-containing protein